MESNMMELYRRLDLNEKRNELSLLFIKTDKLLDSLLLKKGLPKETQAKNYDLNLHSKMTESEILTYFYEDMWHIKNKILELLVEENIKENSDE